MNKNSSKSDKTAQTTIPAPTPPPTRRRNLYGRRRGDLDGVPPWLVSFTDIMALMLTFFVLLYAMSEPEEQSWSEVMAALQKEFHVYNGPREDAGPNDTIDVAKVNFNRALPLDYLNSLLEKQLMDQTSDLMSFQRMDGHLVLSLSGAALFDAGSSEMNESGARQLFKLGNSLSRIRNRIEIVGHSDPAPITNPNSEYPSNWELSLDRAGAVAAILKKTGYQQPVIIRGESSVHFNDLNPEKDEKQRQSQSRRVDIHVMIDDGSRSIEKTLKLE